MLELEIHLDLSIMQLFYVYLAKNQLHKYESMLLVVGSGKGVVMETGLEQAKYGNSVKPISDRSFK